ncbi:Thioesterase OS=Streptomyces rochei OX=1928 GN=G3I25_17225 PE=3 SV=1 [Streptomyces rochei]
MPVLVFAGRDDPLAAPAALRHWQQWTTNLIELHTVAGGHFFASSSSLAQHVGRACRGHVTALPTGGGR